MFSSLLWQSALANLRSLRPARSPANATPNAESALTTHSPTSSRFARFGWLLYGIVSFVFFLALTFPSELILQRVVAAIEHNAPLRLRYASGRWTWGQGWTLEDLSIKSATMAEPLQLSSLALRPSLFGLFYGQPFPLTFSARLYDGAATGTIRQKDAATILQFTLDHLALARAPFPMPWGRDRLSGSLTLNGTIQGASLDPTSWSGSLSAALTDGALKAGTVAKFPVPALQTAQAHGQATLQDGRVEIASLTLEADGVTAQLEGTITLRRPLDWSVMDLRLTTRTVGTPPPPLAMLVSLLPAVPGTTGERRATITGTFATPAMR